MAAESQPIKRRALRSPVFDLVASDRDPMLGREMKKIGKRQAELRSGLPPGQPFGADSIQEEQLACPRRRVIVRKGRWDLYRDVRGTLHVPDSMRTIGEEPNRTRGRRAVSAHPPRRVRVPPTLEAWNPRIPALDR